MQVAGSACHVCGRNIGVYLDGMGCSVCGRTFHATCVGADSLCVTCAAPLLPGTKLQRPTIDSASPSLASLGERLVAQLLDTLIAFTMLVATLLLGRAFGSIEPGAYLAVALMLLYLLLADGLPHGQSFGKKAMGIAVVDSATATPCNLLRSFVRNFSLLILGPLDWVFILGKNRQRIGDKLAHTIVMKVGRRQST